jgi:hypothetical protein
MKITKKETHVLITTKKGEYHFSIEEFEKLSEAEAIKIAEAEIEKKLKSGYYPYSTISFKQAREMGFCEYGIKDFCEMMGLDIEGVHNVEELNKNLTLDALKEYTEECIKIFGKNTLKYLGGVKGVLSEDTISLVLRPEFIPEKTLHILATRFAWSCLHRFEDTYPNDKRPREAIQMKEKWIACNFGEYDRKGYGSEAR